MRLIIPFLVLIGFLCVGAAGTEVKQEKAKDPCDEPRFVGLFSDAPYVSATDVTTLPQCLEGKFVRMTGVYRTSFENSILYDPITGRGGTWVTFGPFHAAVKRGSPPGTIDSLKRPNGGIFGFVALGVFHGPQRPAQNNPKGPKQFRLGYGHMGLWENEFQVICLEKLVYFADAIIFQPQKPEDRQRIIDWYTKETAR